MAVSILQAQLTDEDPIFAKTIPQMLITPCYILLFFIFFQLSCALAASRS